MYAMPPSNQAQIPGWVDLGPRPNVPGGFPPGHNVIILKKPEHNPLVSVTNGQPELDVVDIEDQSDLRVAEILPFNSN